MTRTGCYYYWMNPPSPSVFVLLQYSCLQPTVGVNLNTFSHMVQNLFQAQVSTFAANMFSFVIRKTLLCSNVQMEIVRIFATLPLSSTQAVNKEWHWTVSSLLYLCDRNKKNCFYFILYQQRRKREEREEFSFWMRRIKRALNSQYRLNSQLTDWDAWLQLIPAEVVVSAGELAPPADCWT